MQVLSRLAPFERGIYEDYVANFWCATSIVIKWKRLFTTPSLKLISLAATVSTFLPSMVQQIRAPSSRGFLYAMLNSSFSFYLFSFQGEWWTAYRPIFNFICSLIIVSLAIQLKISKRGETLWERKNLHFPGKKGLVEMIKSYWNSKRFYFLSIIIQIL